ncbi:MAG TPA: cytochrome c oxidase subunit 3, partial [Pricia sp.]|nr:cytochrome c oxidase subunit 3 [Pricia sp.]
GLKANPNVVIRTESIVQEGENEGEKLVLSREQSLEKIKDAKMVVEGANLVHNEYGSRLFADFFFFITGFHGFHVFSGVMINIVIFFNVIIGTYDRRGHYEMVEKVGLYWHFVDLVWVFVFTFFYLV